MIKISVLCSGSKGNATYIEINNNKFLFDAGNTEKYISKNLEALGTNTSELDYIFITHTHTDHVSSLKKIYKKTKANICITNTMVKDLEFLEGYENLCFIDKNIEVDKDIVVVPFNSSHDKEGSINYVIKYKNKKIVYITDTGYIHYKHFKLLENADIYLIESNHDEEMLKTGTYPKFLQQRIISDEGHLSNNQTGFYLAKFIKEKTKQVVLLHLSEENNEEEIAIKTIENKLKENNIVFDNIVCSYQNKKVDLFLE